MARFIKKILVDRTGHGFVGMRHTASAALLPAPLLHGVGGSKYDELIIFGGLGLILGTLAFLSWRSGQKRKKRAGQRKNRK